MTLWFDSHFFCMEFVFVRLLQRLHFTLFRFNKHEQSLTVWFGWDSKCLFVCLSIYWSMIDRKTVLAAVSDLYCTEYQSGWYCGSLVLCGSLKDFEQIIFQNETSFRLYSVWCLKDVSFWKIVSLNDIIHDFICTVTTQASTGLGTPGLRHIMDCWDWLQILCDSREWED